MILLRLAEPRLQGKRMRACKPKVSGQATSRAEKLPAELPPDLRSNLLELLLQALLGTQLLQSLH